MKPETPLTADELAWKRLEPHAPSERFKTEEQYGDFVRDLHRRVGIGDQDGLIASWLLSLLPPYTSPPIGYELKCLVCARVKPWGTWDSVTGVTACVDCRDARYLLPHNERLGEEQLLAYIRKLEAVVAEAKKVKFWGGAYGLRGFNEALAALDERGQE